MPVRENTPGGHTTSKKNVECAHREGGKRQAARRKGKNPGWTLRKGKITTGGRAVGWACHEREKRWMWVPRGWKSKGGGVTRGKMLGGHAAWGKRKKLQDGIRNKLQDGSVTSGGEAGWALHEGEKR